ncbi:hypothetical protein ACFVY9_24940 [Streptomyces sp. NPDC059544]|uniref:hypothetical protein n=1 Tax=Streptomyces sp. NPDC059544 TaxID=3346861 RepID=UPI0036B27AB0
MLIDDMDNTSIAIRPDEDDSRGHLGSRRGRGCYEIALRDATLRGHEATVEASIDRISGILIHWLAVRDSPDGQPR